MNRLTERINDKVYYAKGKYAPTTLCSEMETWDVRECMKKLAAYEDTGLTPEELTKLYKMIDITDLREHISELLDLEEQGRLIKLPCKLGTKLFIIQTELLADGKNTRREKCIIESEFTDWNILYVVDNWGKTVFLTREEAEKALEE